MIFKGFGNDWVAGAPRGLQHRCPDDKSGAGFNSQAFPLNIKGKEMNKKKKLVAKKHRKNKQRLRDLNNAKISESDAKKPAAKKPAAKK